MKFKKIILIGMFLLVLLSFVSATYSSANPNYGLFNRYVGNSGIDAYKCEPGQDFIIQIAPFGCTPAVVRSDLLEEQNVPVFCQLAATKINPLIGVEAIESIAFSGGGSSQYVSSVDFHPARAALGVQGNINSPVMDNIGYAVIVLKEQVNESSMPDFVTGNLTAKLRYDIKNAFGIGTSSFYLPVMSEGDWNQKKNQYSFWNGRGYVRADNVYENGATISLYDGARKISSVNLEKGKTSGDINVPGFDCRATMNVKLDDLAKPGTRAQLMINGETVEVIKGEKFLENRCWVDDIKEEGLKQKVRIYCKEDETGSFFGSSRYFDLVISPKVKLDFEGAKTEGYGVGDYLYEYGAKRIYLGYVGTEGDSGKASDLYILLVALGNAPISKDKLTDSELSILATQAKGWVGDWKNLRGIADLNKFLGDKIVSSTINFGSWSLSLGQKNIDIITYANPESFSGKEVKIEGFSTPVDKSFDELVKTSSSTTGTTGTAKVISGEVVSGMASNEACKYKLPKQLEELGGWICKGGENYAKEHSAWVKEEIKIVMFQNKFIVDYPNGLSVSHSLQAGSDFGKEEFFRISYGGLLLFWPGNSEHVSKEIFGKEEAHESFEENSFLTSSKNNLLRGEILYSGKKETAYEGATIKINWKGEISYEPKDKTSPASFYDKGGNSISASDFIKATPIESALEEIIKAGKLEYSQKISFPASSTESTSPSEPASSPIISPITKVDTLNGIFPNVVSKENLKTYYEHSMHDFDTLIDSYPGEKCTATTECGAEGLYEKIKLAEKLEQKKTMLDLCNQFKESYSKSVYYKELYKDGKTGKCEDAVKISSSENSIRDVSIDGQVKTINFMGIYEPSFKEYGATINIRGTDGVIHQETLSKGEIVYLDGFRKANERGYIYIDKTLAIDSLRVNKIPFRLFLVFRNSEWSWYVDAQETLISVSTTEIPVDVKKKLYYMSGDASRRKDIADFRLNDNQKELINALNAKKTDYQGGMGVLKSYNINTYDAKEYIQLIDVDEDSQSVDGGQVTLRHYLNPTGFISNVKTYGLSIKTGVLKKDISNDLGSDFIFTLTDVNLEKFAKVSIVPKISDVGTSANFSYKIAIEKRAIQLSPEQTREKILDLNESIEKWSKLSGNLGQVVSGLKGACVSLKAVLTLKNFLSNAVGTGDGMARREVMNMPGGWKEICSEAVRTKKIGERSVNYKSLDACYVGESSNIDRDVNSYNSLLRSQSETMATLQTNGNCEKEGGFLETNYIDTDCVRRNLFPNVRNSLNSLNGDSFVDPNGKGQAVNLETVRSALNFDKDGYSAVGVEDARQIQMDLNILNSGSSSTELQNAARQRLYSKLSEVESVAKDSVVRSTFETDSAGYVNNAHAVSVVLDKQVTIPYRGSTSNGNNFGGENSPIQLITLNNKNYYLKLSETGRGNYQIVNVYDSNRQLLEENNDEVKRIKNTLVVKGFDGNSYKNYYKNPEVKYYETEPHKGLPAVVPFDCAEGWYVYTKQSTGALGGLKTYDDSGALRNYYICNVGPNGLEEGMGGDDAAYCRMINKGTGQPYDLFPGLSESQAKTLVMNAERAVMQAARAYKPGVKGSIANLGNCGNRAKVGDPAAIIPAVQCQDTMSPKECQLLFNVCDPVVCPSSRCNAGGTYTVSNVIQSGIIGSLVLCFPNFVGLGGDVYVPVCLSGLKAGLDGLISVQKSYRDCLQENLDTGKMVGICDEVYSIYLCEFLWRQGLPLAKTIIPKILEIALGKNTRGGGEYLFIQDAWNTASTSMSEFVEYYAANSFNAFKARTTEEIGGEICKNFASGVVPSGGNFLDALTQPDVPPQFHGRFDEIPFTDATVPPVSHYKVFYHIFAGNDSGVYYKVFLKGAEGSSFYQDTGFTHTVDSGYINLGETVSETIDFTGTAGYKEMCIRVNNQEECGFKQVSTSYAVNYVSDQYAAQQASAQNINSEEDCIQGTASGYSLLSPNLQEGASELVNQGIYNRGIIRICSGSNPGLGTDGKALQNGSRWVDVGHCGNMNIRCWLDQNSVKNVIKDTETEANVLSAQNEQYLAKLQSASGVSVSEIEGLIKKLGNMKPRERIVEINKVISKSYIVNQKAMLLYWRGKSYSELAGEIDAEAEKQRLELKTQKEVDALKNAEAESLDELGRPQLSVGSDEEQNLFGECSVELCNSGLFNFGYRYAEETSANECDTEYGSSKYVDGCCCIKDVIVLDEITVEDLKARLKDAKDTGERFVLSYEDFWDEQIDTPLVDGSDMEAILDNVKEGTIATVEIIKEDGGKEVKRVVMSGIGGVDNQLPAPALHDSIESMKKLFEENKDGYYDDIEYYSMIYFVRKELIMGIIAQESSGKPEGNGDGGNAYGLMQVHEGAAKDVGMLDKLNTIKTDPFFDSGLGIEIGTAYFEYLFDQFLGKDINEYNEAKKLAILSYNYGIGNVNDACFIEGKGYSKLEECPKQIPFERRQYVANVLAYEKGFQEGSSSDGYIQVSTLKEFIQAIKSGARIEVTKDIFIPQFLLSEKIPTEFKTDYVKWENFASLQMIIENVNDLIIRGKNKNKILAEDMLVEVLYFRGGSNIKLENLVFGHKPETTDRCDGVVLYFKGKEDNLLKDIQIVNCELFGSGTLGITADYVENLKFESSIIRDCSHGLMSLSDSKNINFKNSEFKTTDAYKDLISLSNVENVVFEKNSFKENQAVFPIYDNFFFNIDEKSRVDLIGNTFDRNNISAFARGSFRTIRENIVTNSPKGAFDQEVIDKLERASFSTTATSQGCVENKGEYICTGIKDKSGDTALVEGVNKLLNAGNKVTMKGNWLFDTSEELVFIATRISKGELIIDGDIKKEGDYSVQVGDKMSGNSKIIINNGTINYIGGGMSGNSKIIINNGTIDYVGSEMSGGEIKINDGTIDSVGIYMYGGNIEIKTGVTLNCKYDDCIGYDMKSPAKILIWKGVKINGFDASVDEIKKYTNMKDNVVSVSEESKCEGGQICFVDAIDSAGASMDAKEEFVIVRVVKTAWERFKDLFA